jgi:hypothetical protein
MQVSLLGRAFHTRMSRTRVAVHLAEAGVSICNRNRIMTGVSLIVAPYRASLTSAMGIMRNPRG